MCTCDIVVLCLSGTLGKGTLCTYPWGRVPTHPFRVLGLIAQGKMGGKFYSCKYQGQTAWWCAPTWYFLWLSARFSWPGCHLTSYASCTTLSHTQNYRISINQDHCHLTVLVAMLTAVALLQCIGVLSCGCPNSSSVSRKIIPSLQLSKRAPSLALAVEVTTNQRMHIKWKMHHLIEWDHHLWGTSP